MRAKLRRRKTVKGFADFYHNNMEEGKNLIKQEAIKDYLLGALRDEAGRRGIEEKILLDDDFDEQLSSAEDELIDENIDRDLADSNEAGRRVIEKEIMLDEDFNERLSIAEDELIEQYLDGDLDDFETERFNQFFLKTPERNQKLRLAINLRKYAMGSETTEKIPKETTGSKEKTSWLDGLFASPVFQFASVVLILVGIGFVVWRVAFYESSVDKGLAQLRIAYRGQRPIESRTTANFDYAPVIVTRGSAPSASDNDAKRKAELLLLDAAKDTSDVGAQQALGLFYLSEKNFDDALKRFDLALKLAPNDAKIHSDIAAVYLEKAKLAKVDDRGDEILKNSALALGSVNRALEINGSLLEALFNKALILQNMPQMTDQAREAWEEYLKRDSTSPWANEARKNLEELKQQNPPSKKNKSQILRDFLDAYHRKDDARAWEIASQTKELITGVMIQQQLAQKFLEASRQSRKEEADEILSAFVYLGELEKQKAKDLYFSELASYYKNISPAQRQKLLQARQEMQNGYDLIRKQDWTLSPAVFEQAKKLYSEAGNSWEAQIAEWQIGFCLSQDRSNITESSERLLVLSSLSAQKNHRWIQVLSEGWLGSNYALSGEYSKSISFSQKALTTGEEIGDEYDVQKALNQLTHVYWLIGDTRKTLESIYKTLKFSNSHYQSPRQLQRNLLFATGGLYQFKLYDIAAAFGREEVRFAQIMGESAFIHTARTHLAMILGEAKKYDEALREIEAAFELSNSLPEETRLKQNTLTRLILANLQREMNNCGDAISNYSHAIEEYEKTSQYVIRNYEAHKGRLLCYVAQKDDDAVGQEMPALLRIFDENRQKIIEESNKLTYFDNEQSVYDIAADYYTRLKNPEQAFNYAENSRARLLLGMISDNSSQSLVLQEIQQGLSPKTQIVYYALLADKILIWHISDTSFFAAEKVVNADELTEKIQKYKTLLTTNGDKDDVSALAAELYRLLLLPIESKLETGKTLCVVADKILFRVPFASLVSPQTNKYLIENYELIYAPSATVFINQTEKAVQKNTIENETILSVGNPSFSRKEYPKLEDLPDAAREAEEIGELYNSPDDPPKVLTGGDAVRGQIVDGLGEADVFHFAGHYVANGESAQLSKFLLASGELSVEEIVQKKLSRTRLMVLPACETGIEKFYNGEGMIGAARAFMASGVPLVVASQWMVDSKSTAELMIRLHQYRRQQKMSTIAALRQAQIDLINGENTNFRQPYFWAGFIPIGGYAEY